MEINEFIKRSIRILHIARKPNKEEFSKVAKITALGMFLLGIVGFIFSIILNLF